LITLHRRGSVCATRCAQDGIGELTGRDAVDPAFDGLFNFMNFIDTPKTPALFFPGEWLKNCIVCCHPKGDSLRSRNIHHKNLLMVLIGAMFSDFRAFLIFFHYQQLSKLRRSRRGDTAGARAWQAIGRWLRTSSHRRAETADRAGVDL
jgi:hypothetical protein